MHLYTPDPARLWDRQGGSPTRIDEYLLRNPYFNPSQMLAITRPVEPPRTKLPATCSTLIRVLLRISVTLVWGSQLLVRPENLIRDDGRAVVW